MESSLMLMFPCGSGRAGQIDMKVRSCRTECAVGDSAGAGRGLGYKIACMIVKLCSVTHAHILRDELVFKGVGPWMVLSNITDHHTDLGI